ncbi:MAG: rhodanese-like domain-containing protein [Pseudomonadota bacterium]
MLQDIHPQELNRRLAEGSEKPLLLDVREPFEYSICHIDNSLHIPLNQVPLKLHQLESTREIVVICHHGIRSRQVGHFLVRQGFEKVTNLAGGIDAWAIDVEPAMPRY